MIVFPRLEAPPSLCFHLLILLSFSIEGVPGRLWVEEQSSIGELGGIPARMSPFWSVLVLRLIGTKGRMKPCPLLWPPEGTGHGLFLIPCFNKDLDQMRAE